MKPRLALCLLTLFLVAKHPFTAVCQPLGDTGRWWHDKPRFLHYRPEGTDFVLVHGTAHFNRALYGTNTAFRVETGDLPEFAMYMPGMGGNLQFGLLAPDTSKWIIKADSVRTIYRPGSMIYEIRDGLLGKGMLKITVLALADAEGMIVKAEFVEAPAKLSLLLAFGGASGKKFSRDGDIGADPESSFYLQPSNCRDNVYHLQDNHFVLDYGSGKALSEEDRYEIKHLPGQTPAADTGRVKTMHLEGMVSPSFSIRIVDAARQTSPAGLYASKKSATPAVCGAAAVAGNGTLYFLLRNGGGTTKAYAELPGIFEKAQAAREKLAARVKLVTPDPYINTLGGALSMAADAIWEDPSYLHGAVAWRMRLNAWRGPYVADPLGWHDRARKHFSSYALSQVTSPASGPVVADTALHLARQLEKMGTSMFSSGYISRNPGGDLRPHHYDMNLVFIDELLNHFNWTGDLEYVKKMWPLLQRHLAWEKRNFDADGDGLYDAYCCIWASDALQYSSGGVTHSSAYNYRANKTAALLAEMIGEDPEPYRAEAEKILNAMNRNLWMPSLGWYAEYKDFLGLKSIHPAAALWTIYHAIDAKLPDPFQAYQSLRYIDKEIPHIPVKATGLNEKGLYVLSTTNWQPYTWSLNNVVLAESQHTALAYWQAGNSEEAFQIWRSSLIESMYLSASPGGFEQLSFYDAIRGELYRDFADPIGMVGRSLVEGLFGILPDALHDTLTINPGFPASWNQASISLPDVSVGFNSRSGTDSYLIVPVFAKPMHLKLRLRVRADGLSSVKVNGGVTSWKQAGGYVGQPIVEIAVAAAPRYEIELVWKGKPIENIRVNETYAEGETISCLLKEARPLSVYDPEHCLSDIRIKGKGLTAISAANGGNKTCFVQLKQGEFTWWSPLCFRAIKGVEVIPAPEQPANALSFYIRNNTSSVLEGNAVVKQGNKSFSVAVKLAPGSASALFTVPAEYLLAGTNTVIFSRGEKRLAEQQVINWNITNSAGTKYQKLDFAKAFNDKVTNIFKNQYLSPRSPYATLQLPTQGFGNWCYPLADAPIDDAGLRKHAGVKNEILLGSNVPFSTTGNVQSKNVLFTSLWDNYPDSAVIPLAGKAVHVYLLMAGSTNPMQTHMDNGMVTVRYKNGSASTLYLRNPETWWPIDEDYYTDGFAFTTNNPRPVRVLLKTGIEEPASFKDYVTIKGVTGMAIDGGAATVLDLPLNADQELSSLSLKTLSNDVVIGLMSATLVR